MSILIVGSEGAQGKRYNAILKHLRVPSIRVDVGHQFELIRAVKDKIEGIILTTPTHTHIPLLNQYMELGKPILVEKPITKYLPEFNDLILNAASHKCDIQMIYQYRHLVRIPSSGHSYYNYFRHGNDGLVWDCLQIIGLANGSVNLAETSPVWECEINGNILNIADMDYAYVKEISSWLGKDKKQSLREIKEIHAKVSEHAEAYT